VRGEQDRAAQTLDVERAPYKQPADVADAARGDERTRQREFEPGRRHDCQVTAHVSAPPPRQDRERDERERVQLRRSAHSEGHEVERTTFAQQGDDSEEDQDRRRPTLQRRGVI
jgi:hypothetical protein